MKGELLFLKKKYLNVNLDDMVLHYILFVLGDSKRFVFDPQTDKMWFGDHNDIVVKSNWSNYSSFYHNGEKINEG